jgi:SRSO17 transposase
MMPITNFLSCTEPLEHFDSLSYHHTNHAKAYVSGLLAASNKTIEGIANHVMPSASERALNKFLGEYDWDEEQLNLERLDELQQYPETRWSQQGTVVIDDSFTEKTGDDNPNAGRFYDHADGDYLWGQNLVFSYYTDDKTGYPLGFRLYEKDADSKIELAKALVREAETQAEVPAKTYLFDSWYCAQELIEEIEAHGKDWISVLKSDRQVEFANQTWRIDELHAEVDLTDREIDGEEYRVWTKKVPVSQLGEQRVLIAEKVTDDGENPVKYLVSSKIDAPSQHIIRSYGYRWRIETFFEDSKQDLGFADCEAQRSTSARRHWQLVMLAYSLARLAPVRSADDSLSTAATSLRPEREYSLKESICNFVTWIREQSDRAITDIMAEFDDLFKNVRS